MLSFTRVVILEGFVPFGFEGIVQGAAILFYLYFVFCGMVTAGNMVIVSVPSGVCCLGCPWAGAGEGKVL